MSPVLNRTQNLVIKLLDLLFGWVLTTMKKIICADDENVDYIMVVGNIPFLGVYDLLFD